jgi:tryptophan synthase alpha chain
VIDLIARVSPTVKAPIVLFAYYNPIYQRGFEKFVKEIADAGAKGLLVPDIPLEETLELTQICAKNGLDLVLLSTPTTPIERMEKIAKASNGFIYLVSVTGVTGVRTGVESRVEELVKKLKTVTDKPICVGFGISKEEQAQQVVRWGADGVIVGSALVKALGEAESPEKGLVAFKALAEEIRRGSNRAGAKPEGARKGGFFANLFGKN